MYLDYYYDQLKGRLYIKNNNPNKRYAVGGLKYQSEHTLKRLLKLEVGDQEVFHNDKVKRVQ